MDFDIDSIKSRIITSLQAKSSWANILFFSTNQRLVDAISEEIYELARYSEYMIREAKWSLAQNRSSLISQSQLLRYTAHRKIGAIGQVRVSADETFAAPPSVNIEIPKWSVFSNGDDIQVTNIQSDVITTSDNYIDVNVVQGTPKSSTFIAVGDIYEEILVENDSFENVYYEVFVNDILWTEIDDLREATNGTSQVYETRNSTDFSGVIFRFGNNTFGKKLDNADTIVVRYVETLGSGGNVTSTGIITTVESTIRDINSDLVDVFVNNTSTIDGGTDEEDIEDIRVLAPKVFQAAERATSSDDYKTLLLQNALVANVNVWGAYEVNLDNGTPGAFIPAEENVVHIAGYTASGANFSSAQQDTLRAYLNPLKPPTDILQFDDTVFIEAIFNVDAFVNDRSNTLSSVKNDIVTGLSTTYNLDNRDFNENLNYSDVQAYIDGILPASNDYHDTTIALFLETVFTSAFVASFAIPIVPVETGTVKIYIKNLTTIPTYILIGTDDGAGNFTAEPGYALVGSSVNYSTGAGTLVVSSGLSEPPAYTDYTVKVEYELQLATFKNNIVLSAREQIIRYAESNVTVTYIT